MYLALTIPHANNEARNKGMEVPDYGIYAEQDWPEPQKGTAAMITRMDRDLGRLFALLKKRGVDENTVVMFTSDNGPHAEGGNDPKFFDSNGPLRGIKRDLYEGGIRVPMIVRWPGGAPAGKTSDHSGYFGDFFATACELGGAKTPDGLDSLSFAAAIRGQADQQKPHEQLYWEFYERGSAQAVRQGKWKAVRKPMLTGKTELYDLSSDIGEERNIAAKHPDLVRKLEAVMDKEHVPADMWKVRGRPAR